MEAYKVQSTLELRDLVGARLAALIKDMDLLEKSTVQARRRLRDFGAETAGLRSAGAAVRAMQRDMMLAERNLGRMGVAFKAFNASSMTGGIKGVQGELQRAHAASTAFTGSLSGIGIAVPEMRTAAAIIRRMETGLAGAARNANMLVAQLHGVASAMRGVSTMPNIPRSIRVAGGGTAGGGAGHGGNVHLGTHGLGIGAVGLGALGVATGGATIAGYLGYQAIKAGVSAATDYDTARMRFRSLNLGDQENADADSFVRNTRHFGVDNTEMMRILSESVGLFGNLDEAKKFSPRLAELGVANSAIFADGRGSLDEHGLLGLTKFIDRRGGFKDEESFERNLNLAQQLITGSGGRIRFEDLDQFSQRGGTAFRGYSDDGIRRMAGLIIEQGGNASGVGMMSLYQNLIAGRTPKKTMAMIQDMGLGELTQIDHGMVGGKKFTETALKNITQEELLRTNPAQWMAEVLLPKINAYETKKQLGTGDDVTLKLINDVLSNRTGSNSGSILSTQQLQMLRDYHLNKNAMNADQTTKMFSDSAAGKQIEFEKAWSNFKQVFGESVLPGVIQVLDAGTALFKNLSAFDQDQRRGISAVQGQDSLWGKVKAIYHWGNGDDLKSSSVASSTPNPIAAPAPSMVTVHSKTILDGRTIADIVTRHQADNISANKGTGAFDIGLGMPSFGMK